MKTINNNYNLNNHCIIIAIAALALLGGVTI